MLLFVLVLGRSCCGCGFGCREAAAAVVKGDGENVDFVKVVPSGYEDEDSCVGCGCGCG